MIARTTVLLIAVVALVVACSGGASVADGCQANTDIVTHIQTGNIEAISEAMTTLGSASGYEDEAEEAVQLLQQHGLTGLPNEADQRAEELLMPIGEWAQENCGESFFQ